MNNLLIFFALPIAVIIISAILQKLLKCPVMVAALIFAIFLVVTFTAFDEMFLIVTFAYTVLAFITALLVRALCQSNNNSCLCEALTNLLNNQAENNENANTALLSEILNNINNTNNNTNSNNENNNNNSCGCGCRYNRYRRC